MAVTLIKINSNGVITFNAIIDFVDLGHVYGSFLQDIRKNISYLFLSIVDKLRETVDRHHYVKFTIGSSGLDQQISTTPLQLTAITDELIHRCISRITRVKKCIKFDESFSIKIALSDQLHKDIKGKSIGSKTKKRNNFDDNSIARWHESCARAKRPRLDINAQVVESQEKNKIIGSLFLENIFDEAVSISLNKHQKNCLSLQALINFSSIPKFLHGIFLFENINCAFVLFETIMENLRTKISRSAHMSFMIKSSALDRCIFTKPLVITDVSKEMLRNCVYSMLQAKSIKLDESLIIVINVTFYSSRAASLEIENIIRTKSMKVDLPEEDTTVHSAPKRRLTMRERRMHAKKSAPKKKLLATGELLLHAKCEAHYWMNRYPQNFIHATTCKDRKSNLGCQCPRSIVELYRKNSMHTESGLEITLVAHINFKFLPQVYGFLSHRLMGPVAVIFLTIIRKVALFSVDIRVTDLIKFIIDAKGLEAPISTTFFEIQYITIEKILLCIYAVVLRKKYIILDEIFSVNVVVQKPKSVKLYKIDRDEHDLRKKRGNA